jgi:hypothetical protein
MSTNNSDIILELNLLDNGIDFILKGIDELFDEQHAWAGYSNPVDVTPSRYKYGYLHLFSGFLLLLKERLSRHLPELIFKGKIAEVKQRLASGKTPNTVDLDEALERLEIGPKVTFSDDELKVIRNMQDFRNQFEHYKVSANKYQLWANVSEFLALIDRFLVQELQITIESSADSLELRQKIQTIESIWERIREQREQEWKQDIQYRLKKFKPIRKKVVTDLEGEHLVSKGDITPFIYCPECGEETLIVHGEYAGICANPECNGVHPLTHCDLSITHNSTAAGKCGRMISNQDRLEVRER